MIQMICILENLSTSCEPKFPIEFHIMNGAHPSGNYFTSNVIHFRALLGRPVESVFDPQQWQEIALSTALTRPALEPTLSPVQHVLGAVSPGVKQPRCEADHSSPSSDEVKNILICTCSAQYLIN
jgi:hypothetical protein